MTTTTTKVENMNSIFVVIGKSIFKGSTTKVTLNDSCAIKAFRTKRQAFEFIEQYYYADIERIKTYIGPDISNVYIGNDVVRIEGSYALYGGLTVQFLYEYRIEKIPFE